MLKSLRGVTYKLITKEEDMPPPPPAMTPLDIECYPQPGGSALDPYTSVIRLVGLKIDGTAYILDLHHLDKKIVIDYLQSGHSYIAHNATYEYKQLTYYGVKLPPIYCTMTLAKCLHLAYGHKFAKDNKKARLDVLVGDVLGYHLPKDLATSNWGQTRLTRQQLLYNAKDVWLLKELWDALEKELRGIGSYNAALLRQRVIPVIGQMELSGVSLDLEKLDLLKESVEATIDETMRDLCKALKLHTINQLTSKGIVSTPAERSQTIINGPSLLPYLRKSTGLDLKSTRKDELTSYGHPIIELLLKYRGAKKALEETAKYKRAIHPVTGNVYSSFINPGTFTGRISSKGSSEEVSSEGNEKKTEKINLQQAGGKKFYTSCEKLYGVKGNRVPITFRNCIYAREGVLWDLDYSGQEVVLLATLGNIKSLISALTSPEYLEGPNGPYKNPQADIHTLTARSIFDFLQDVPDHELVEQARKSTNALGLKNIIPRDLGKMTFFSLIYGSTASGIANKLNIPESIAAELIEGVYKSHPGLKEYMEYERDLAFSRNWIETAYGQRLFINEENAKGVSNKGALQRRAFNARIQGSGAEMTHLALDWNFRHVPEAIAINAVHDGLLYWTPGRVLNQTVKVDEDGNVKVSYELDDEAIEYGNKLKAGMILAEEGMLHMITSKHGSPIQYAAVDSKGGPFWAH